MKILEMSGEMANHHDNTAIVLSRLHCMEFRGNKTRPWLYFSIRNDCNKSSVFYNPLFTTKIEFTCSLKLHVQKSMWRHQATTGPLPTVQSASKYSKGIYIIHESRFIQGRQLGPDSLMAEPPFITAEPTLWSRLGSHLAHRIETLLKYSIMH